MRIKDLPEASTLAGSEFLAVDSNNGTKKVSRDQLLGDIDDAITAIEGDISDIQGDVSTLQGDVTTIQGDISDLQSADTALQAYEPLRVNIASFSTLPQTVSSPDITEDMVVLGYSFSRPSSQTSEWTVTTSNGALTVSGSINGWTALTLILGKANV